MWLSPVTVSAPAAEPISVDQAKQFVRLGADDTAFDVEIGAFITGARAEIEALTCTRLVTQSVRIGASTFSDLLRLPIGPVQDIVSITYRDPAGADQVVAIEDCELFGESLDRGIRPVPGLSWPAALCQAGSVQVTLSVGYGASGDDLPADIRVTLLLAVRAAFDDRPIDLEAKLVNHRIWL